MDIRTRIGLGQLLLSNRRGGGYPAYGEPVSSTFGVPHAYSTLT